MPKQILEITMDDGENWTPLIPGAHHTPSWFLSENCYGGAYIRIRGVPDIKAGDTWVRHGVTWLVTPTACVNRFGGVDVPCHVVKKTEPTGNVGYVVHSDGFLEREFKECKGKDSN